MNNYHSVVLYCDMNRSFKSLQPNVRATRLLQDAGHTEALIHGDCYFGRALDDERIEWERLDFTTSDLSSDASWLRAAKSANQGKNMSAYTSTGALKSVQQQQQKQGSGGASTGNSDRDSGDTEGESGALMTWSQNSEEVELKFVIPASMPSKRLKIVISARKLTINVVDGSTTPIPPSIQRFMGEGVELYNAVNVGDSTWSIGTEGKEKVLCVSLAKAVAVTWPTV